MNIFLELKGKWGEIDLNAESKKQNLDYNDPDVTDNWIRTLHRQHGIDYSYGKVLEYRDNLLKNQYQAKTKSFVHLGVDYTVPSGSRVFMPYDGTVKDVFLDKDQDGGWGGRAMFHLPAIDLYLILGHLAHDINLQVGQEIKKGELIGKMAEKDENGHYWLHIHGQLFTKHLINSYNGDLKQIDGYCPMGCPKQKHIRDPGMVIRMNNKG